MTKRVGQRKQQHDVCSPNVARGCGSCVVRSKHPSHHAARVRLQLCIYTMGYLQKGAVFADHNKIVATAVQLLINAVSARDKLSQTWSPEHARHSIHTSLTASSS
jgi:hypothetical protein